MGGMQQPMGGMQQMHQMGNGQQMGGMQASYNGQGHMGQPYGNGVAVGGFGFGA